MRGMGSVYVKPHPLTTLPSNQSVAEFLSWQPGGVAVNETVHERRRHISETRTETRTETRRRTDTRTRAMQQSDDMEVPVYFALYKHIQHYTQECYQESAESGRGAHALLSVVVAGAALNALAPERMQSDSLFW